MKILAIDPGTHLGWAISGLQSGTEDLSVKRYESQGMRFVKLERFLDRVLSEDIELVVYEDVARHLGVRAAHVYGGIESSIQRMCEERGINYVGVPVGTIKKHATGKGNSGKEKMLEVARGLWPEANIQDKDYDRADALCLWQYAQFTFGGKGD